VDVDPIFAVVVVVVVVLGTGAWLPVLLDAVQHEFPNTEHSRLVKLIEAGLDLFFALFLGISLFHPGWGADCHIQHHDAPWTWI
jgi:hypothetical protein